MPDVPAGTPPFFGQLRMTTSLSTPPALLLYGNAHSGHSYKVRLLLLLSPVPHHYQPIALDIPRAERPAAFVAASRFGEVPVLIDGGVALCQSNAILLHVAQRTGVFGGAPDERSAVTEWLFWETNRIGFSVPNLRFALRWAPQPAEVLAYLRARALADLQTLDEALERTEFLLPSGPTIADIACAGYLFWLDQAGIEAAAFAHVARWLNSLSALPGWAHPDEALAGP